MSLSDLEAAGELEPFAHSPEELGSLMRVASRRSTDAELKQLSSESRVVSAYQCVLACAKAALRAQDYRVPRGLKQHYITIQTLRFTLGLDAKQVSYCQGLRSKRHRDEYEGTLEASDTEADEAAAFAANLFRDAASKLLAT